MPETQDYNQNNADNEEFKNDELRRMKEIEQKISQLSDERKLLLLRQELSENRIPDFEPVFGNEESRLKEIQDELASLSTKNRLLLLDQVLTVSIRKVYHSPYPDPESLARYEKILPGFSNRILKSVEAEQEMHKFNLYQTWKYNHEEAKRNYCLKSLGQIFAFILFSMILAASYVLIAGGQSWEGFAAIITAASGMAGVFLFSKNAQSTSDSENKQDESNDNEKDIENG